MGGTVQVSDLLQLARDMGLDPEFEGWASRASVGGDDDPHLVPEPSLAPITKVAPAVLTPSPPPAPAEPRRIAALRTQVPRPPIEAAVPRRSRTRLLLVAVVPVAAVVGLFAGRILMHPTGGPNVIQLRKSAAIARQQVAALTVRLDATRAAAKEQQAAGAASAQHAQQVAHDLDDCTTKANALVAALAHVDPHDLASASGAATQVAQSCGQARTDATPPPPPPPPPGG